MNLDADDRNICALRDAAAQEPFARRMGITCTAVRHGYARCEMHVDPGMANLFGMAHGGAVFSLMDDAFQLACNTRGTVAYALNLSVTYIRGSLPGELLVAEAREIALTQRTGTYEIRVFGSDDGLVAIAQALAYRKKEPPPFSSP